MTLKRGNAKLSTPGMELLEKIPSEGLASVKENKSFLDLFDMLFPPLGRLQNVGCEFFWRVNGGGPDFWAEPRKVFPDEVVPPLLVFAAELNESVEVGRAVLQDPWIVPEPS